MPNAIPTPVAAALGLVPTVLGGVRRLPGKAIALPVFAVSSALTTLDTARREYDALAERGERLLARLRGTSFDELEDRFEDRLQGTRLAKPYDAVEDALEDATENVTALVRNTPAAVKKAPAQARKAAGTATKTTGRVLDRAADTVEDAAASTGQQAFGTVEDAVASAQQQSSDAGRKAAATANDKVDDAVSTVEAAAEDVAGSAAKAADKVVDKVEGVAATVADKAEDIADEAVPEDEAPKGAPTPKATEPDATRIDTAASESVVETVERVSSAVGGEVLAHDELPLPDYDHLTLGSLRGRMRSLDLPQLIQVRDYEKAHADRLPIVTMLDNRIAKLASDPTAPLSGSAPTDPVPAKSTGTRGGSKVSPVTTGPAQNPPTGGVPTNPAQPRSTG